MYRQNFRIIFFFNEAKNAGIAYVLARIFNMNAVVRSRKDSGNLFNEVNRLRMGSQGKKKLKFPIDNCGLVLRWNNHDNMLSIYRNS